MEQPEKTAAEPLAEGGGRVLFIDERGVVELEFVQRVGQVRVIVRGDRVDRGEDDRLDLLKPGSGLGQGRFSSVIVSPVRTSDTVFTPAIM